MPDPHRILNAADIVSGGLSDFNAEIVNGTAKWRLEALTEADMGWPSDDNYIELSWGGRRIFRIGPKGVGIILVAEILIVGAAVASIIWVGLKLSGTI